jgi:hypothetical protein
MSSEPIYHPAAEIVAIALRKICKVANSRKYAKLHEECRLFLDELHLIIPAAGTAGGPRLLIYGRSDVGSTVDLSAQAGSSSRRSSMDGRAQPPSVVAHAAAEDTGGAAQPRVSQAAEAQAAFVVAEDEAPGSSGTEAPPGTAAGGEPTGEPRRVPPSSSPSASQLAARELGHGARRSNELDSRPGPAGSQSVDEPELPDLVPRTDTALPDPVCDRIIGIFRLAVDTMRPEVIEVALDCIQKLVAFRFLQVRQAAHAGPRDRLHRRRRLEKSTLTGTGRGMQRLAL